MVLVALAAIATFAYRRGWHRVVLAHRTAAALVGVPTVVVVVAAGWYLGSPLFTSKTVDEALPFDLAAAEPTSTVTPPTTSTATPAPTDTPTAGGAPAGTSGAPEVAAPAPTPSPTATATAIAAREPFAVVFSVAQLQDAG